MQTKKSKKHENDVDVVDDDDIESASDTRDRGSTSDDGPVGVVVGPEPSQKGIGWLKGLGLLAMAALSVLGVLWVIDQFSGDDAGDSTAAAATSGDNVVVVGDAVDFGREGFGLMDQFNRPSGATWLGDPESTNTWTAISGEWAVEDGVARVTTAPERGAAYAVHNLGTPDATIEVAFGEIDAGSGLVFRFRSVLNHWQIQSAPTAGTWVVRRIAEGESTEVLKLGLSNVDPGARLAVAMDGDRIAFYVDGILKGEVTDGSFQNATRAGMLVQPSNATTFQYFVAIGHSKSVFGTSPNAPDPDDAAQFDDEDEESIGLQFDLNEDDEGVWPSGDEDSDE